MFILWLIASLALVALAVGVVWRVRVSRPALYPEVQRPLSTTPGRHKLVK